MSEKIEKIMKRIHVFFSNCDVMDGTDDRIIVPKKPMINLLNELNQAIYEVMEQYELTEKSREREINKHKKKAEAIIEEADRTAEDIYASSMMYTDRMLIEMRNVIEQAGKDLKKEYDFLAGQLTSQIDMVTTNQNEVRHYLQNTKQNSKYMDIIMKYNDRIEKVRKEREAKKKEYFIENEEHSETDEEHLVTDKEDSEADKDYLIKDDEYLATNEEYFASDIEFLMLDEDDETSMDIREEKAVKKTTKKEGQKQIKKVASIVDASVLSDDIPDDTIKRVTYEIKVNPMYYQGGVDLSPEMLDAEYEQWKAGDEDMGENQGEQKKDKKKVFPKKKKR